MSNDKPDYYAMAEGISKTIGKVTKPLTDAQFIALAGAVAVYVEKALAHEAEKQAGPVAVQPYGYHYTTKAGTSVFHLAGSCDEKVLAADMQAAIDFPRGHSCIPVYTAQPSPLTEQDKEDAELTDDEILACRRFAGAGPDTRLDRIAFGRAVLRAARAKKEK